MGNERKTLIPCEAPYHVEGCNGYGGTIDHFTPTCIAELYGWDPDVINSETNWLYLSRVCHNEKDRRTLETYKKIKLQMQGGVISMETVRTWAKGSAFNKLDDHGRNIVLIKAFKDFLQMFPNFRSVVPGTSHWELREFLAGQMDEFKKQRSQV